jgi:3D (Asp-Asp-Asp) domain-containing protein
VVLNSPDYVKYYRRPKDVDFDTPVIGGGTGITGTPLSTLAVEVTHYCPCPKCCGDNADGYTASGKLAVRGMIATSSHYPFGTQMMINGIMYTVEDRGGSGIENNIHRVDIFVPTHSEALRLGRYKTTAMIYRVGR